MNYLSKLAMMALLSSTLYGYQGFVAIDQPMTQLATIDTFKDPFENELYLLPINFLPEDETDFLGVVPMPSRRISMLQAFQRFVQIFLIILNNPRVQSGMKTVEAMMVNLVQIGLQALKINAAKPQGNTQQEIAQNVLQIDPALKNAFIFTLSRSATSYNPMPICKGKTHSCCCEKTAKQPDRTTQVVLNNFAIIANHFINILQDPENSENVAPNLIGMLERIVTIGTEVIKSGKLNLDTSEQEIIEYVQHLDDTFKEELITTLYRTVQRRYYQ